MRATERLRLWLLLAAALAALAAGALALIVSKSIVVCDAELSTTTKPDRWQGWPVEEGLGGFEIDGRTMIFKYGLGLEDTELRDPGLCPRGGVSLDGWFVGGPQPNIYRSQREIRLRREGGVWVVSGIDRMAPEKEVFIVAFTRQVGRRLAFTSGRAEALSIALLALLAITALGLRSARGARREASSYGDIVVYKPGVRDAAGLISFDDGTPPIPPERADGPHAAGPVLVRVAARRFGSFREAPSTRATAVLTGDAETLAEAVIARATASVRSAVTAGVVILVVAALVGACLAVGDELRNVI
jgi:hypothetical protein